MIILLLFIISLFSKTALTCQKNAENTEIFSLTSPLVLVPGNGGSRSYANINFAFLNLKRHVWVNFQYMLFPGQMTDVFKLIFNPITNTTDNVEKTQVSFPGWGSTEMIEHLNEWKYKQTTYFAPLVNELMRDPFYVRNKTIRGAPYDFRKAPNENIHFVDDLKRLIEDTYEQSGNERIVLLGHSLGSLYSLYFLKKMPLDWKKQYIRSFISVSAPLGGAVKALKLQILGDSIGSPRDPLHFREMQRSFPSTAFLLPRSDVFGYKPIVITKHRNYSVHDFEALFKDMEFPVGYMMYQHTKNLVNGSETPEGIDELHCIHGIGLKTDEQIVYSHLGDKKPEFVSGDGDFTVNIQSLHICKNWHNVNYHTMPQADHMAILEDPQFLNRLKQILYQQPNAKFSTGTNNDHPQEKFIIRFF